MSAGAPRDGGIATTVFVLTRCRVCDVGCDVTNGVPSATLACVYVQRWEERAAEVGLLLTEQNVNHVFLTAYLLACKVLDDPLSDDAEPDGHASAAAAAAGRTVVAALGRSGGVCTIDLARMEICFLMLIGFDLYVSPEEYAEFCDECAIDKELRTEEAQRLRLASLASLASCGRMALEELHPWDEYCREAIAICCGSCV
jgi:hypothetical protein